MFPKNNAEQSHDSKAEMSRLRFVTTSPVRFPGKIVRMCRLRSATQKNKNSVVMFPDRCAEQCNGRFATKCHDNSVAVFPDNSAKQCRGRYKGKSVNRCLGPSAKVSQESNVAISQDKLAKPIQGSSAQQKLDRNAITSNRRHVGLSQERSQGMSAKRFQLRPAMLLAMRFAKTSRKSNAAR